MLLDMQSMQCVFSSLNIRTVDKLYTFTSICVCIHLHSICVHTLRCQDLVIKRSQKLYLILFWSIEFDSYENLRHVIISRTDYGIDLKKTAKSLVSCEVNKNLSSFSYIIIHCIISRERDYRSNGTYITSFIVLLFWEISYIQVLLFSPDCGFFFFIFTSQVFVMVQIWLVKM